MTQTHRHEARFAELEQLLDDAGIPLEELEWGEVEAAFDEGQTAQQVYEQFTAAFE